MQLQLSGNNDKSFLTQHTGVPSSLHLVCQLETSWTSRSIHSTIDINWRAKRAGADTIMCVTSQIVLRILSVPEGQRNEETECCHGTYTGYQIEFASRRQFSLCKSKACFESTCSRKFLSAVRHLVTCRK